MPEAAVIHWTSPGPITAAAGRVAVFHFALIDDGHRFKPAMRMLTHAAGAGGRAEFGWRRMIQQQERAHFRPQIVIREQRIHPGNRYRPNVLPGCCEYRGFFILNSVSDLTALS